jgi:hypothetical protein
MIKSFVDCNNVCTVQTVGSCLPSEQIVSTQTSESNSRQRLDFEASSVSLMIHAYRQNDDEHAWMFVSNVLDILVNRIVFERCPMKTRRSSVANQVDRMNSIDRSNEIDPISFCTSD